MGLVGGSLSLSLSLSLLHSLNGEQNTDAPCFFFLFTNKVIGQD